MDELQHSSESFPDTKTIVILESTGDTPQQISDTARRILNTQSGDASIVASIHVGSMPIDYQEWQSEYNQIQLETPGLVILGVDKDNNWSHAYSYLYPIFLVSKQETARIVVEIDGGGGHLPEEISGFIFDPKKISVALSTRFAKGGTNLAPLQRKIISHLGTLATNILTIPPKFEYSWIRITDGTSGFESFSAEILGKLFEIIPIESFICVQKDAPFHLYQTEMRAYLLAILSAQKKGSDLCEIPITYGKEKRVSKLPIRYTLQSAMRFAEIRKNVIAIFDSLK